MSALAVADTEVARWSRWLGVGAVQSVRSENRQTAESVLQHQSARNVSRNIAKSLHSSSPSRHQHERGDEEMLSDPVTRICSTSSDPASETRTRLQRSLTLHVTDPAKVVARKVAASPDTVESHRQAVPKSWASMIAYCRAYPAFGLEVLDLMGIDIDRDREAYSLFLQLQKQVRGE